MARIKLELPPESGFIAQIPVRIQDVNYGGHVGNDALVSVLHESRLQFLNSRAYRELDNEDGTSLIMSDVVMIYKGEAFHGDIFKVSVTPADFTPFGFDLYYRITAQRAEQTVLIAEAKTGMLCFDYSQRKLSKLTPAMKAALS